MNNDKSSINEHTCETRVSKFSESKKHIKRQNILFSILFFLSIFLGLSMLALNPIVQSNSSIWSVSKKIEQKGLPKKSSIIEYLQIHKQYTDNIDKVIKNNSDVYTNIVKSKDLNEASKIKQQILNKDELKSLQDAIFFIDKEEKVKILKNEMYNYGSWSVTIVVILIVFIATIFYFVSLIDKLTSVLLARYIFLIYKELSVLIITSLGMYSIINNNISSTNFVPENATFVIFYIPVLSFGLLLTAIHNLFEFTHK